MDTTQKLKQLAKENPALEEQLAKVRFFGRCIGQKVKYKNEIYELTTVTILGKERVGLLKHRGMSVQTPVDISDCQIIGRRTSQMTSGEYEKYNEIWEKNSQTLTDFYDLIDYLFSIGVFPDVYFDELKRVVEK